MGQFTFPATVWTSAAFVQFRRAVTRFLAERCDEESLSRACRDFCLWLRTGDMRPEQILIALHSATMTRSQSRHHARSRRHQSRFTSAVFVLMKACFGADVPVRVVHDPSGGDWTVFEIREGWRQGPDIAIKRRDWLCCANALDRRYISPIPLEWERWPDAALAVEIRRAPPDLRR